MSKKIYLVLTMLLAFNANAAINVGTLQTSAVTLSASGGDGGIALSWTVTGKIRNIQVMRDTDANPKGRHRVAILPGGARNYTDHAVANGRQYWYWIKYTDASRNTRNSNAGSATADNNNNGAQNIAVTGVTVTPTNAAVTVGSTASLGASVMPSTAGNKAVSWRSSAAGVATVNASGVVTGLSEGTATITATTADGGRTASSTVKVLGAPAPVVNYTLDIGASGNGTTSVAAGSHSYKAGTAVTITATPGNGAEFSGWSGAATGNTNPLTLTMNGNQSLTAIFVAAAAGGNHPQAFVHPGLLHTQDDFDRMRTQVAQGASPWREGWERLTKNPHSALTWKPRAQAVVYRGLDGTNPENYALLYNDIAAAYALALRWKVSGDDAYADRAVAILDAWSATLTELGGNGDKYLSSGIYGYQFANAAEIMRDYQKWPAANLKHFQDMMLKVFYPMNHYFLTTHNGSRVNHHFANWDLSNMASMIAIGVFADRRDIYDEAIEYFKHGGGNGAIEHVIWKIYPQEGLGQTQEAGRDQGHNTLIATLLGAFCQMAWNQNDDLFGYDDNRVLKGMEYIAKYNLGENVPYTPYVSQSFNEPVIAEAGRGTTRPGWELLYNHYVVRKGLKAPYVQKFAEKVRPEGGGGDYGPNSGGYDQIGYGTLTATLGH